MVCVMIKYNFVQINFFPKNHENLAKTVKRTPEYKNWKAKNKMDKNAKGPK